MTLANKAPGNVTWLAIRDLALRQLREVADEAQRAMDQEHMARNTTARRIE